jgi:hypothetical protein
LHKALGVVNTLEIHEYTRLSLAVGGQIGFSGVRKGRGRGLMYLEKAVESGMGNCGVGSVG